MTGRHAFRLYRSGWSEGLPWDDNQLWAESRLAELTDGAENRLVLDPMYGAANSWYQVFLRPAEAAEAGWTTWRARLVIDNSQIGYPHDLPLSWYVGAPADWPSGLARFPEGHGPRTHTFPDGGPRGIWTLAVRRAE